MKVSCPTKVILFGHSYSHMLHPKQIQIRKLITVSISIVKHFNIVGNNSNRVSMSVLDSYSGYNLSTADYFTNKLKEINSKKRIVNTFKALSNLSINVDVNKKRGKKYSPYMSLWNIRILETFYDTRFLERRHSSGIKKTKPYENRKMSTQGNVRLLHGQILQDSVKKKGKILLKAQSTARLRNDYSDCF